VTVRHQDDQWSTTGDDLSLTYQQLSRVDQRDNQQLSRGRSRIDRPDGGGTARARGSFHPERHFAGRGGNSDQALQNFTRHHILAARSWTAGIQILGCMGCTSRMLALISILFQSFPAEKTALDHKIKVLTCKLRYGPCSKNVVFVPNTCI